MIIDKFHTNYSIQRGREDPYALQKRMDKIASNHLEKEIDPLLTVMYPDNSYLIFIKNITLDLAINLAKMNDQAIAKLWAEQIMATITKILPSAQTTQTIQTTNTTTAAAAKPYIESNLAVFPNRAVYLAYFIHDLLKGTAAGKWYYQEFNDMDAFSYPDIIKLVCKHNQEILEEIFLVLNKIGGIDKILFRFSGQDAKFLYSLFPGDHPGASTQDIKKGSSEYERVVQLISEIIKNGRVDQAFLYQYKGSYKLCLKIYIIFLSLQEQRKYTDPGSKTAVKKTIETIILEDPEFILKINDQESKKPGTKKIKTAYGGLFLLIPVIQEIELADKIQQSSFPVKGNISAVNAFLYFMALHILRQNSADHPYIDTADPGLLIFTGMEPTASTQYLVTYPEMITTAMCQELLNSVSSVTSVAKNNETIDYETLISLVSQVILKLFAGRLMGFEKSSSAYICNHFLQRYSEIVINKDTIHIKLSPKPLDTVLRMSSLLEDSVKIPWLGDKKITFTLEG